MVDVLLTYGWVRSVYAALRNLASHGCSVHVACSEKNGMCHMSKYRNGFSRYPSFHDDQHAYVEAVVGLVEKHNPLLLLPGHDDIEILAKYRSKLPKSTVLPVHDYSMVMLANDKSATQEAAQNAGVATPRRYSYSVITDLFSGDKTPAHEKFVIRLRRGNSAKGVFYATSKSECSDVVGKLIDDYQLLPERYPVVQEYVAGEGWGVSCLYWHGERIAHFTHRRLREKITTGGTSTLREHKPNSTLEKMAFAVLDSLHWHGLAMVEFKFNPSTGMGWFIEINPRLWGSIHLAISAGVEFPYLLFLCARDGPDAAIEYNRKANVKYPWRARWYLGDVMCAIQELKHRHPLKAAGLLLPGGADTYDDLSLGDPGAFLGELLHYGGGFIKSGSINPVEGGMIG